jgi:hypothetical protein
MAVLALSEVANGVSAQSRESGKPSGSLRERQKPSPSRCGVRYHNGYSWQTCLRARGHSGKHTNGWDR